MNDIHRDCTAAGHANASGAASPSSPAEPDAPRASATSYAVERIDERARQDIERGQCINKPLMPEHVAQLVLFLAADDSLMCTGQDLIVDAGWV